MRYKKETISDGLVVVRTLVTNGIPSPPEIAFSARAGTFSATLRCAPRVTRTEEGARIAVRDSHRARRLWCCINCVRASLA